MTTDTKVKLIWFSYVLGISTAVSQFVGIILAYVWRKNDEHHILSGHFDRQIRLFWKTGAAWMVAFVFMAAAIYLDIANDAAGQSAKGEKSILFSVGLLIGIAAQLVFCVTSVFGGIKALRGKP